TRGVPAAGTESADSSGLSLQVTYTDEDGNAVDVSRLTQGSDFVAHVEVRNVTSQRIDNIALTHVFPAGWEIHNDRMDNAAAGGSRDEAAQPRNPWMSLNGSPMRLRRASTTPTFATIGCCSTSGWGRR